MQMKIVPNSPRQKHADQVQRVRGKHFCSVKILPKIITNLYLPISKKLRYNTICYLPLDLTQFLTDILLGNYPIHLEAVLR